MLKVHRVDAIDMARQVCSLHNTFKLTL